MNLQSYYEKALSLKGYEALLGDQRSLHDLHYKKAQTANQYSNAKKNKILVITEPWCGDSLAILPVIMRLFEAEWEIKVSLRDQNEDLIDQFLTKGGRAIPIVLFLDADGNLLGKFGPRPEKVQNIFEEHRQDINDGKIEKSQVIKKIRTFYSKDKGATIAHAVDEVVQKMI